MATILVQEIGAAAIVDGRILVRRRAELDQGSYPGRAKLEAGGRVNL